MGRVFFLQWMGCWNGCTFCGALNIPHWGSWSHVGKVGGVVARAKVSYMVARAKAVCMVARAKAGWYGRTCESGVVRGGAVARVYGGNVLAMVGTQAMVEYMFAHLEAWCMAAHANVW